MAERKAKAVSEVLSHASDLSSVLQKYKEGDIIRAAQAGDVKKLEQCINFGANIEEQGLFGETALMSAACYRQKAAVEFLVARNANVNHTNRVGGFALSDAAESGDKDICKMLLEAGADKDKEFRGKTAAQWATAGGHKDLVAFIESWGQVRFCQIPNFLFSTLPVSLLAYLFSRGSLIRWSRAEVQARRHHRGSGGGRHQEARAVPETWCQR